MKYSDTCKLDEAEIFKTFYSHLNLVKMTFNLYE